MSKILTVIDALIICAIISVISKGAINTVGLPSHYRGQISLESRSSSYRLYSQALFEQTVPAFQEQEEFV